MAANGNQGAIQADALVTPPTAEYYCDFVPTSGSYLPSFQITADSCSGTILNPSATCSVTIGYSTSPGSGPFVDYYLIDPTQGFFVESDLVSQGSGQVTLGYFAVACDVTSTTSCQQAAARSAGKNASRKRSSLIRRVNSYSAQGRKGRGF